MLRVILENSTPQEHLSGMDNPGLEISEGPKVMTQLAREDESKNFPAIIIPDSIVDSKTHPGKFDVVQKAGNHNLEKDSKKKDGKQFEFVKPKKEMKGFKRFWGIGLGLLSSLIFSTATLNMKLLGHYHPFSVCMWRFIGTLLPSILIILHAEIFRKRRLLKSLVPSLEKERLKLLGALFVRSSAGCGSYILYNLALHYMAMPDATVICFSTPIFVTFLARIFLHLSASSTARLITLSSGIFSTIVLTMKCKLKGNGFDAKRILQKEHCGVINVFAAIVALIGVTVIVRPPFLTGEAEMDTNLLIGGGCAFGAMTLLSIVYLCLRVNAVKSVNFSVVTFAFGLFASVESGLLAWSVGEFGFPVSSKDWLMACAMAFATFTGQVCATIATKYEEAGIVSLTRSFDVLFAFIWQFIFLGVTPTLYSLVGSLIVISGIVFVVLQKYLQNLPSDSTTRKNLKWLLY